MSQRAGLTPQRLQVLEHLERIFPAAHNAQDVVKHPGMTVRSATFALLALRRRGYARLGPGAPTGTSATEVYEATSKPSERER